MRLSNGFTLLEVLIVIVIIGIVIGIALPSMQASTQKNRVDTMLNKIEKSLILARNHSQNYIKPVTVCPLGDNKECSNNWSTGIDVFIDDNGNLKLEDPDTLLKGGFAVNAQDQISFPAKGLTFNTDGQVSVSVAVGTTLRFRYCSGSQRGGVDIASSGRTEVIDDSLFANCD
ncbi:GspH/FimT family pseudopilin [Psychromonas ossibalaenae]|uniref:GspH/FimT family pseudopilin n=1 Tax=Psychromonas ossibalaenae TaxID=444922 RepID=UPI00037D994C|nr:GspH/FimT family pseudopilin [Psychromonas ossibalaenae]